MKHVQQPASKYELLASRRCGMGGAYGLRIEDNEKICHFRARLSTKTEASSAYSTWTRPSLNHNIVN